MEIYMNDLTTEFPYELPKNMKFIEELEHGAFGQVILVRECFQNIELAIKVINKIGAGSETIKRMKEEISILKKLEHENIVKFYGYIETNNQLLIEMEYIKYGTLGKWMKEKRKITEVEASIILGKVLSAIIYLHNMRICHRDIKPENIMFSKKDDFSSVKIIDFGLSAQHFNYLSNNEYCGTILYMAPEQIEKKFYYYSVDIWSIGILMFMLLNNGKHPFYQKGDKIEDLIKKIKNGKLQFVNKVSYMAKNLMNKLCEPNPSWRYSADLAIKHPWITRNIKDEIPLTFNEILKKNNNKKNAINLIMINIFLNYIKKKSINSHLMNFKKRKNNKIFKINYEYISQCKLIWKEEREKNEKLKEKYLEVISTDEEDSFEKMKQNYINKKKYKSILDRIGSPKIYYNGEQKTEIINMKKFQRINNKHKDSMKLKRNILNKGNTIVKMKERRKLSFCQLVSMPNKNKNLDLIQKEKTSNDTSYLNISEYLFYKSDKNLNSNKINLNSTNKSIIKYTKNKSIGKLNIVNINKTSIENKNTNSDLNNRLDKTKEKNTFLYRINKYKLKPNLPYVSKCDNNYIKTTNKKINNYIRNKNIVPLFLPFIGVK